MGWFVYITESIAMEMWWFQYINDLTIVLVNHFEYDKISFFGKNDIVKIEINNYQIKWFVNNSLIYCMDIKQYLMDCKYCFTMGFDDTRLHVKVQ